MTDKNLTCLTPHTYATLVNQLTQTASSYAGMGQLRERLSSTLNKFVRPLSITKAIQVFEQEHPRALYALEILPEATIMKVPRGLLMPKTYAELDRIGALNCSIMSSGQFAPDYDLVYIRTGHQTPEQFTRFASGHRAALMQSLNVKDVTCTN